MTPAAPLSLQQLSLGEAGAQRVESILAPPARFELAGDAPNARLELVLALGEPALALGQLARCLGQLALGLREVVERQLTGAPSPLECLPIHLHRILRGLGAARLPSHSSLERP